jgi:hypothetical protein
MHFRIYVTREYKQKLASVLHRSDKYSDARSHFKFRLVFAGQKHARHGLFSRGNQHSSDPAQTISAPCQKANDSGALSNTLASAADNTG